MSQAQQDGTAGSSEPAPDGDGARRDPPRGPQQPRAAEPPRKGRARLIILLLVGIIAVVAAAVWWLSHRNELTTDDAFTDGRAITVAPRVSGSVVELDVTDNQFVRAGQRLIRIDPRDFAASRDQALGEMSAITAQLINARANLAVQQVTQPARLAAARAQLDAARASAARAARDNARFRAIDPAATTKQDIDAAFATDRQAVAAVAQAQAQVDQASTVNLDLQQAQSQIAQLQGQMAQAQAKLDQANLNMSYTELTAPQDGWVARRNVEQGAYVQVGATLFSIVTPDLWVTANYKEDELRRLRAGQHVRIRIDAYPQLKLEGHVDSVQLGSGSKFSTFPAENATGNFVKIVQRVPVKIAIDRGLDPHLPLPLGISAVPTVDLR